MKKNILFLCTGNSCRCQMALAELNSDYASGFISMNWVGAGSIMIYTTGYISIAHCNPAIALAF